MKKWKDTARTCNEILRNYTSTERAIFQKNALVIIEKDLSEGMVMVIDSNPNKEARRKYKLKTEEIIIEDYCVTRDINIQMLLADGWDAQDLLR